MLPIVISGSSAVTIWLKMLYYLTAGGEPVSPRGMGTVELRPATLVLKDPRNRWVTVPERKISKKLGYTEAFLLLAGMSDAALLIDMAPQYVNFTNQATGRLDGAYGPRVGPQLGYVRDLLRRDPDTRQAVITIFGPEDHRESRDVPCTVSLHFMVRSGALELVVYMRSNDAWLGWPYDVVMFTVLQEALATDLGLQLGQYTHIDGSLHLYDRNRKKVEQILTVQSMWGLDQTPDVPMPELELEKLIAYAVMVLAAYKQHTREGIPELPPFFETALREGLA